MHGYSWDMRRMVQGTRCIGVFECLREVSEAGARLSSVVLSHGMRGWSTGSSTQKQDRSLLE